MNPIFHSRRHLVSIQSLRMGHRFTDCLVIGSGVAGLRAAIEAAGRIRNAPEFGIQNSSLPHSAFRIPNSPSGGVLLVAKAALGESNTWHAQGGVAAVLDPGDSIEAHLSDTIAGGGGLCDEQVVRTVVTEGPDRVGELIDWGAQFDQADGRLVFTREGGHSAARIVHAHGDATGREIAQTLLRKAEQDPSIELLDSTFIVDLITDSNRRCRGALAWRADRGPFLIWAGATILATGGAGQIYRESTNPAIATADGHAMAWRAGATLSDMEMIQFHPTTLYIAGASRALISEAVRGEGAYLIDRAGERFMVGEHPLAELAPRDVVSRAIWRRMDQTDSPYVLLDVRHIGRERFARRFPGIFALLKEFDIDVGTMPIPVRPAAHYMMSGVVVDLFGRTGVPGLYACGEVTATGLHGANRLGSNSLLEGLVYGARAGRAAVEDTAGRRLEAMPELVAAVEPSQRTELDLDDVRNSLRSLMGRNCGVEREGTRLAESREIIDFWARYVMDKTFSAPPGWELQNMLTVAALVTSAALARTESRGAHFRRDYPETDDHDWRCHLDWTRGRETRRREVNAALTA